MSEQATIPDDDSAVEKTESHALATGAIWVDGRKIWEHKEPVFRILSFA
jgi:hypothetical protein